jgi:hypothetical protein
MLDEISGLGAGWLDRLLRSKKAKSTRADGEGRPKSAGGDEAELDVSSELRALLGRVKGAETMRKGLVHAVVEKLNRGELVTSETVREAAEKILREGP